MEQKDLVSKFSAKQIEIIKAFKTVVDKLKENNLAIMSNENGCAIINTTYLKKDSTGYISFWDFVDESKFRTSIDDCPTIGYNNQFYFSADVSDDMVSAPIDVFGMMSKCLKADTDLQEVKFSAE